MINVRELRIGNTVKGGDYTQNPSVIIKIEEESATAKSISHNEFTSIHGISLYDIDVKYKYGFTDDLKIEDLTLDGIIFNHVHIGLKKVGDGRHEVFIKVGDSHFAIRKITYLHELQNLVFALFDVEL